MHTKVPWFAQVTLNKSVVRRCFFFSPLLISVHEQGCALWKIEGTPLLWYPGSPTYDFYAKKQNFLVTHEQKLGAMGHQALLEHSFEEITQIREK